MAIPVPLATGQLVTAALWNDHVEYMLGLAAGTIGVTSFSVIIRTSAFTPAPGNLVLCSGTFTVTLPAALGNATRPIWVVNNGSGVITVGRTGADTVGLATSQSLFTGGAGRQGDSMAFFSDNISNWNIL